jgi:predicted nucleic acid-binding Zn ribbon protein
VPDHAAAVARRGLVGVETLGSVLSRLFTRLGLDEELAGWRVVEEWPRLVGPRIAQRTRAVAFHEGTLRVEVEGSAWMHELSYLKHELIRKINRELGSERIRDVRFVIPRKGVLR